MSEESDRLLLPSRKEPIPVARATAELRLLRASQAYLLAVLKRSAAALEAMYAVLKEAGTTRTPPSSGEQHFLDRIAEAKAAVAAIEKAEPCA